MLRRIVRRPWYMSGGLFSFDWLSDNDKVDSKPDSFYREHAENETGWDRLYLMYSSDEFGNMSPEMTASCQSAFFGMFIGACYGGFINSKLAYIDFIERNEATAFKSHLEAKKLLQDQVSIGFGKGAFRWGWRLGLFTGTYVLLTTTISVYRGKSSIVEYVAAGGITGAVYKCSLGLRGMAVGGGLGSVLGGLAGICSLGVLKITGMSMEEIRYWQYQWKEDRKGRFLKSGKYNKDEDNALIRHHDERVGTSGLNLESLESAPSPTQTS